MAGVRVAESTLDEEVLISNVELSEIEDEIWAIRNLIDESNIRL